MELIKKARSPRAVSVFMLTWAVLFAAGCGSDPEPETTRVRNILTAGEWSVNNVSVNSTDQTDVYKNLKVTFTPTGYTSSGGAPLWPASGQWSFSDDTGRKISRSDNIELTITEITDKQLTFTMPYSSTTFGPGRSASISGNHIIKMTRP